MSAKIKAEAGKRKPSLHSPAQHSPAIQPPELPFNFRALMTQRRPLVLEALQLWGDFPDCNPVHCCAQDWQHILISRAADLFEQLRFDESDPLVHKAIIKNLATIATICEQWAENLEEA